ncbi:hypothetical protein OIV83_000915 [Microbotryomycetes sp. JL201]|nr:hypothetical protein OIV83_000915 [Microbotryomycetes sp. JL201]
MQHGSDTIYAGQGQGKTWKDNATSSTRAAKKTAASGQEQWDSCMQQCQSECQASAPSPSWSMTWNAGASDTVAPAYVTYTPPYTSAAPTASSPPPSTGNMPLMPGPNQVIVAPIKGDLRMVPFNIQAAPGTVIEFIWGAGPHTVTKSSLPNICQKTMDAPFASGVQQAGFKWNYTVKSNETISYFCGVEPHCQKGMFGLINGLVSLDVNNTMDSWMKSYAKQNSSFAASWNEADKACKGTAAASWGGMLDATQFPDWALPASAQAILTTRSVLAQSMVSSARASDSSSLPSSPVSTGSSDLVPSSSGSAEPISSGLSENGATLPRPTCMLVALTMLLAVPRLV